MDSEQEVNLPHRGAGSPRPSTSTAITLSGLPPEVLIEICRNLCLHCRVPYVVGLPLSEIEPAFDDQDALSKLSRCCTRLRDIAQPILFHWYHCQDYETDINDRFLNSIFPLSVFVHTLMNRPGLAESVRALALYTPPSIYNHDCDAVGLDSFDPQTIVAALSNFHSLDRFDPQKIVVTLSNLHSLAVLVSPNLAQLCAEPDYIGGRNLESGSFDRFIDLLRDGYDPKEHDQKQYEYPLPNLKCLAIPAAKTHVREPTYYLHNTQHFLTRMPNLECLIAPDCGGGHEFGGFNGRFVDRPWDTPLHRLNKLSLSGIDVEDLAGILLECPVVEDLEFFHDGHDVPNMVLDPEVHLGHLKKTLRRLCYSMIPTRPLGWDNYNEPPATDTAVTGEDNSNEDSGSQDDDNSEYDESEAIDEQYIEEILEFANTVIGEDGERVGDAAHKFIFTSFTALEVLELDQIFLHHFESPIKDVSPTFKFMPNMPPRLSHLRIGAIYDWDTISWELGYFRLLGRHNPGPGSYFTYTYVLPQLERPYHIKFTLEALKDLEKEDGLATTIMMLEDWLYEDPPSDRVRLVYPIPMSHMSRGLLPRRPGEGKSQRKVVSFKERWEDKTTKEQEARKLKDGTG